MKSVILISASICGFIGGYIPTLWGDGFLSLWSVVLSTLGGFVGIWLGYKLATR